MTTKKFGQVTAFLLALLVIAGLSCSVMKVLLPVNPMSTPLPVPPVQKSSVPEQGSLSDAADSQVQEVKKETPETVYPITDNKTYRVSAGKRYACDELDGFRVVEILEVKLNGVWKEVYRTEDQSNGNCFSAVNIYPKEGIKLSPLGDYVEFGLVGYEWGVSMLVNTKTKQSIYPKETYSGGLVWSKNARDYAYITYSSQFDGSGKDALWVSAYNNPDFPKQVFSLDEWAGKGVIAWEEYQMGDLRFINNQTIEFSIFRSEDDGSNGEELARYNYDLKEGKLTELFRK